MLAIATMAVLIGDVAHGTHSTGFVIAYMVLRSIMLGLYARAWRAVPEARPITRFYGIGYAVGVAIWLASLAFDPPARYVVWGVALALELSMPPLTIRMRWRVPTSASHVPERWALFTLIVLGESVVAVALSTAGSEWRADSAAASVLGFAAVAGVWWLYFDRQASVVLAPRLGVALIYSYAHLPLLMGLAAMSAGMRLVIEHADDPHLAVGPSVAYLGGVVLFLVSLVVTRSVTVGPNRLGVALKLGAVAILVGLVVAHGLLSPVALAADLALVLATLIVVEGSRFPSPRPGP
jgi:low temperature requirement protein LtrA